MRVLVLGASGMIGSAIFHVLSQSNDLEVWGSIRNVEQKRFFSSEQQKHLVHNANLLDQEQLVRLLDKLEPQVVINCVGLTKHHKEADDVLLAVPLNTLLPHRLAEMCSLIDARLIHISTDCIFSGARGNYLEGDQSDATDIYGKSKYLGELLTYPNAVTLRTSTIGHEFQSTYGLLEWFLSQKQECTGFSRAIFSGLPNTVFAEIIRDYVIPRPELQGLYHVGATPINKYDLLELIATEYKKEINILRDDKFIIDRSLNVDLFNKQTGYSASSWQELIQTMRQTSKAFYV